MRQIKFFHRFSAYLLPCRLRRKLKRWRSGLRLGWQSLPRAATKIALATVLVVGAFLGGGTSNEALAADYYINYLERQGSDYYQTGTDGSGNAIYSWRWDPAGYFPYNPTYDHTFSGGLISTINLAGASAGNQVLVTTATGYQNAASPGSGNYLYQSNWGSTTTAGGIINISNAVTLNNQRGGNYTITNITKNGGGVLTMLDGTYTNANFTGSAGGITLAGTSGLTTSGNAKVGGVNGFTFNTGGRTWAVQGGLTASNTFTKAGAGDLTVTGYSDITGSSRLTGGTWSSSMGVRVGQGGTGNLTTSSGTTLTANALIVGNASAGAALSTLANGGTMTTTTSRIGVGSQGTVTNNSTWTGSDTARIGEGAQGSVTNNAGATWSNAGQVTVGGTNASATGTVTNSGTMTWSSTNATLIGQTGHGVVTNSGIWNTRNAEVRVGAGGSGATQVYTFPTPNGSTATMNISANGFVDQYGTWNAAGQNVYAGYGAVALIRQNSGTWTNDNTYVGYNARGYTDHSGGTHNDINTIVGGNTTGGATGAYGRVALHNSGSTWNTTGYATIGLSNVSDRVDDYNGFVEIYDSAIWNIGAGGSGTMGLTVGESGNGRLDIFRDGKTYVKNGGAVIAKNAASTSVANVYGSGSLFQIEGTNQHLIVGNLGNGKLNVYNLAETNLLASNNMYVGKLTGGNTDGTVNIYSGGKTYVRGGDVIIAEQGNTTGTLNIYNPGTLLHVTGNLITGQAVGGTLSDRSLA